MAKRYGQITPIARALVGTDIFCISQSPYGANDPFYSVPMTRVSEFIQTNLSPLQFVGTWNADTNTPTLASSVGVNGNIYVVNTAGSTNLNGFNNWKVGDWAVFDGNLNQWTQVANEVISNINIYNSDGTLTDDRTLTLGGHTLKLGSDPSAQIILNGSQEIYISAGSSVNIDATAINVGSTSHQLNILTNTTKFWTAQFQGSQQYLTVNSSGVVVPAAPPTDTNIYNSDGALTDNRTVTLGASTLFFVGSTGSTLQFSAPSVAINGAQATISSSAITFNATQFVSQGIQWLTTDNSGNIIPVAPPSSVNIYNSDGTLTGLRTITMGSNPLTFLGTNNFSIECTTLNLGMSLATTVQLRGTTIINQTGFVGGGNQYIGVSTTGNLQVMPTPVITNIYNSDGSLSGNRNVTVGANTLTFSGAVGSVFNLNIEKIYLGGFVGGGSRVLTIDNTGLIGAAIISPVNIYNTDGTLTGNRVVTVGANSLTFNGIAGSILDFNFDQIYMAGNYSAMSSQTFEIASNIVQLTSAPFVGGGTKYLTTDNTGKIIPVASAASVNIYNTNGILTNARNVDLGGFPLTFNTSTGTPLIGMISQLSVTNNSASVPYTINIGGTNYNSQMTAQALNDQIINLNLNRIADSDATTFSFSRARGTSTATSAIVQSLDSLGWIDFFGYDGSTYQRGATILAKVYNAGPGSVLANLLFQARGFVFSDIASASTHVQNGYRSYIFGGQTNRISPPITGASLDNFIFGGNTNTTTSQVNYTTIMQSDGTIVGNNTNLLVGSWVMNCQQSLLLPNGSVGNGYMADLNGVSNTLAAHYAFCINGKNCNLSSPASGLGGRYFLANIAGATITGGFFSGALNSSNITLSGAYTTLLSTDGCNSAAPYSSILSSTSSTLGVNATLSTIVAGASNNIQGAGCSILFGVFNTINNVQYSGAIGSNITIAHNQCVVINDGGNPISTAKDTTILIQAVNGVSLGRYGNNPTRDVAIGRKVQFTSASTSTNFNTDTLTAIMFFVNTSGGNVTMTLSTPDRIAGNFFIVKRTSSNNSLIIVPATGTIDGGASFTMSGGLNGGGNKGAIIISDGKNWFTVGAQ